MGPIGDIKWRCIGEVWHGLVQHKIGRFSLKIEHALDTRAYGMGLIDVSLTSFLRTTGRTKLVKLVYCSVSL